MPIPPDWAQKFKGFVENWKAADANPDQYIGDNPFPNFILSEQAATWEHYLQWLKELNGRWCFRGQREASWFLDTSLDRAVKVEVSGATFGGYYHLDRETEQKELLMRFQQQAHQYAMHVPQPEDIGSWLSMMQHHGVPTRLLDWTLSPYVALYFAVAEPSQGECSAVWGIDLEWLHDRACQLLSDEELPSPDDDLQIRSQKTNSLISRTEKPVIVQIEPMLGTERLTAQQGLLLCKLYHQASFTQMLMTMMIHPTLIDRPVIRQLTVARSIRFDFIRRLREMNIHSASLFPGLDGFGRNLRLGLEIKVQQRADSESKL